MLVSIAAVAAGHAAARLSEVAGSRPPTAGSSAAEAHGAAREAWVYGPASEAEALGCAFAHAAWHLLLGALLGWTAAHAMRGRSLDYRLAARVLGLLVVLEAAGLGGVLGGLPVIGGLGAPALILGAAVAVRLCTRWERAEAEQERGGGIFVGARPGPRALPALRRSLSAGARAAGALPGRLGDARGSCPEGVPRLGRALARRAAPTLAALRRVLASSPLARPRDLTAAAGWLLLGDALGPSATVHVPVGHTVVVGATGSGKTVTLRRLLQSATAAMGVVAVDGKGDPQLEHDLARFAAVTGRRFVAWSPAYETRYSPFSHGEDTEIVDKALAAQSWGDDYYLRLGQRFLGFAVRALRAAGVEPTLSTLARYADPERLEELAGAMEAHTPGAWNALLDALPHLGASERQAIAGTQHRLAAIAESDIGHLLEPAPGHDTLELFETVRHGEVAYLNLSADSRPELSRLLGAAIVLDLVSIAASVQARRLELPTVALLDDLQAFATPACMRGVASLAARGRSAGVMLLLGTQSLADLRMAPGEGPSEQILGNRGALIVHRLPGHESAARASRELGDRTARVLSERLTGEPGRWRAAGSATRTPAQVPNVLPRELMQLPTGVAVLGAVGERPCPVRVRPPV